MIRLVTPAWANPPEGTKGLQAGKHLAGKVSVSSMVDKA
jgi:hypothetical protein